MTASGGLPAFTATYRGFDDVALTAAASAGLVRRARGLLTTAPPAWVSQGERDGVVLAHRQEVRLDAAGPASARCACPTAGVCVHVVLACLFVHEAVVAGEGSEQAEAGGGPAEVTDPREVSTPGDDAPAGPPGTAAPSAVVPTALDDLTALTPARAVREAGVVAARAVAARLPVPPDATAGTAGTAVEPHRIVVTWDDVAVVLVAGAGWAGVLVPSGVVHQRASELRLEAVVRARLALGLGWEWPDGVAPVREDGPLTGDERELLTRTREVLAGVLASGVARWDASVPVRVEAAVAAARAQHLPELARALARVSDAARHVVAGSDAVDDGAAVGALARAWALTRALEAADGEGLARLRGRTRELAEAGDLTVQPLGAWTWTATSGARGATVAFVTGDDGVIHASVAGRAHRQDPTFDASRAAIWGVPVRQLLGRGWSLRGARSGSDAEVSSSERTQAVPGGDHDAGLIASAGVTRWSRLPQRRAPRLVGERTELALLTPASAGRLTLDEVDQQLVWPLVDADGEVIEVRLGVLERCGSPADHLTRLAEAVAGAGLRLRHVLVRRDGAALVPMSAVVVRAGGELEIRSFTLGWPLPRGTAGWSGGFRALQKALEALRARVERRPEEAREDGGTAVGRLCERVGEGAVDVAVSGRRRLSDGEREQARDLARRCGDAGLILLAGALTTWAEEGTGAAEPEALLRVVVLAERAAAVA